MLVNSDFKELLRIFSDSNVKYLVIGGYAVIKYAEPRYTKDLDLWVKPDTMNAEAVFNALRLFRVQRGVLQRRIERAVVHPASL